MSDKTLRILLIEDDEHDAMAFKRAFKKSAVPAKVTTCRQAEGALSRLRTDAASFDVAVVDHKLPGMSGIISCQRKERARASANGLGGLVGAALAVIAPGGSTISFLPDLRRKDMGMSMTMASPSRDMVGFADA